MTWPEAVAYSVAAIAAAVVIVALFYFLSKL